MPQGHGVVKIYQRVDVWRLPTFEGAPKEGLYRAWEPPAGDAHHTHSLAPGRDARVRLGIGEGESYSRSLIPGQLPQLLYFGPDCGDLDTLAHGDRQLDAGKSSKISALTTNLTDYLLFLALALGPRRAASYKPGVSPG